MASHVSEIAMEDEVTYETVNSLPNWTFFDTNSKVMISEKYRNPYLSLTNDKNKDLEIRVIVVHPFNVSVELWKNNKKQVGWIIGKGDNRKGKKCTCGGTDEEMCSHIGIIWWYRIDLNYYCHMNFRRRTVSSFELGMA
jgi:hypothetical protein